MSCSKIYVPSTNLNLTWKHTFSCPNKVRAQSAFLSCPAGPNLNEARGENSTEHHTQDPEPAAWASPTTVQKPSIIKISLFGTTVDPANYQPSPTLHSQFTSLPEHDSQPPCLPDKWQPNLIKCFQGRGLVGLHDRPKVITMEIHNYSCQRFYCPADINLIAPSNNDRQSLVCTLPHPVTLSMPWPI